MLEVKSGDLDFWASLIPQRDDLRGFLTRCLDHLIATTSCCRACLILQGTEGRLELALGRDEKGATLSQIWPELCWVSLGRAVAQARAFASQTQSGVAFPVSHWGETLGALYVDFSGSDRALDDDQQRLCEVVAAQMALVLAQARSAWNQEQMARRWRDECADNEALRGRVDDLERINDDLRHFAHFASHDLHEPLRAVLGYSAMLKQELGDTLPDSALAHLQKMGAATQGMARLLRDLLDFVQLGDSHWNPQRLNSADLVNFSRSELAPLIQEAQAAITRDELPWLVGDPTALRLLFRALISNAVKFRRGSHPQIEIGAVTSSEATTFWIRDDGVGIPTRYLGEVFQPFRRLHTRDEFTGSGLGLAMARRIVKRHGGRIWIEGNPLFGVTVYFELPSNPGALHHRFLNGDFAASESGLGYWHAAASLPKNGGAPWGKT